MWLLRLADCVLLCSQVSLGDRQSKMLFFHEKQIQAPFCSLACNGPTTLPASDAHTSHAVVLQTANSSWIRREMAAVQFSKAGPERKSAGCPRSLEQALAASSWTSLSSAFATLLLSVNSLNAMPPRRSQGPSGLNGEEPTPSDWLFWFFWKGSRVWIALDQARTACNRAEADPAWEYVAAKILERFGAHGMEKKVQHGAQGCFNDLETLAREVTALVEEQPGDASRILHSKMVGLPSGSAVCSS